MSFGLPGPGGSMGCCAWCGEDFCKEVLRDFMGFSKEGAGVVTGRLGGFDQEMAFHRECADALGKMQGRDMDECAAEMPDGPLRRAIEASRDD